MLGPVLLLALSLAMVSRALAAAIHPEAGDVLVPTANSEVWAHLAAAIGVATVALAGMALRTRRRRRMVAAPRSGTPAPLPPGHLDEVVGRLTAGVAHDYNNLLMSLSANLEFLERDAQVADAHATRLAWLRQAVNRGAGLTRRLQAAARTQILRPQSVDLNALILQTEPLPQPGDLVRRHLELAPGLWPAMVDPGQVAAILLNLTQNAREALPGRGTISVRTENQRLGPSEPPEDLAAGDYVVLTVADNGVGMAPAALARACDPFFTTKAPGGGAGLGLSQVAGIARQSGGAVRIVSAPAAGTLVRVYLPRAGAERAAAVRPPARPATTDATVLVIDDDAAVLDVVVATLASGGFRTLAASDGAAALHQLQDRPDIDLVLVDFAMPGMNGAELAQAVRALRPRLPVAFMTGHADPVPLGAERFILQKPFRAVELVQVLGEALASGRPLRAG